MSVTSSLIHPYLKLVKLNRRIIEAKTQTKVQSQWFSESIGSYTKILSLIFLSLLIIQIICVISYFKAGEATVGSYPSTQTLNMTELVADYTNMPDAVHVVQDVSPAHILMATTLVMIACLLVLITQLLIFFSVFRSDSRIPKRSYSYYSHIESKKKFNTLFIPCIIII